MVSWPRGLGTGLQNRLQRFESARDLKGLTIVSPFLFIIIIYQMFLNSEMVRYLVIKTNKSDKMPDKKISNIHKESKK